MSHRRAVVQHIVNRIGNRRRIPLCIVVLVCRIHGAERCDRSTRKARIVVPTEEAVTGTRCRLNRDIRIQNGIARHSIRIGRRVSRRGAVIQMPVHRIALRGAPLRIIVLVRRIARAEAGNRRTRERSVIVPAFKVIAGARCGGKGHIRIQHRIARDRVRIVRRVSRRGSVIQAVLHRIALRCTPLCIKVLGRRIHRREAANRRARERCIVIPAEEGVAVPKRRKHIDGAAAVCEHRVAREIRSRIARGVSRRCAVVQMVANRIGNRRCIPLRIKIFICRIRRTYRRNRASRKAGVIVPA